MEIRNVNVFESDVNARSLQVVKRSAAKAT